MKRTAIGAVTALSVWFGSALAAEAQTIQPTGPMSVTAGSTSSTFTATVTIPQIGFFQVKVNVYLNGNCIHQSTTLVPNPGMTTYNFSKLTTFSTAPSAGQVLTFSSCLVYLGRSYYGNNWLVTVSGTRPTSKNFERTSVLALQGVANTWRRA